MNKEKINAYELPNRYEMKFAEIYDLANDATKKGNADALFEAIYTAYKYGFIRGGNRVKNNARKAKREALRNG